MLSVFLMAILFCIYTYLLFPLWLALRVKRLPASVSPAEIPESELPSVSILIAAHNEERYLDGKLATLQALDYPKDRLQVVIVSDGSSDRTVEILQQAPQVILEHYAPAQGKPSALNRGLARASGEFIVFMDARQRISANAIRALLRRFADPAVGAVSGELALVDSDNTESENVGLYWRYEKWIRHNESRLFSTTGATGALYAMRRADVPLLPADTLLDDFEIPISTLANGKRTVFEPDAIAYEVKTSTADDEFKRKVRTLAGNFQAFTRQRWLFSPAANPVFWQFVSHKVFRLLVPVAMAVALIAAAAGQGPLLSTLFWLQILFYFAGLLGLVTTALDSNRLCNLIKVFLQLNFAVVVGAYRYYSGSYNVKWKAKT